MRQPAADFLLAKQLVGIMLLSSCWCAIVHADPPAEAKPAVPGQTQVEITPEVQKQMQAEARVKLEKARTQLAQDLREDRAKQEAAQKQALAQPQQPAIDPQQALQVAQQQAREDAVERFRDLAGEQAQMRAQAADRLRIQMQGQVQRAQGLEGPAADAEARLRQLQQLEAQALIQAMPNAARQRDPVDMIILRNKPAEQFKEQYVEQANQKIEYLTTVCNLRPDQIEKMRLAFAGDISRIMNRIVALRHDLPTLNLNNRDDAAKFSQLLQSFGLETQSGSFAEGTLARTVLERTLDEHQKQAFEQNVASRHQNRQHALTLLAVATLDEQLGLSKDQREQLVELLNQQSSPDVSRSLAPFLGQIKLARTSDEDLSKILDAEQIALVRKFCDRYRNLQPGGR